MYNFGNRSRRHLETLDERLKMILVRAITMYNFSVISGHRGEEEQANLFYEGRSMKMFPNSKHNYLPSLAVDIAPWPIDWTDTPRFYVLAGIILACASIAGVKLRWGGDWDMDDDLEDQTFQDLGHFEIVED